MDNNTNKVKNPDWTTFKEYLNSSAAKESIGVIFEVKPNGYVDVSLKPTTPWKESKEYLNQLTLAKKLNPPKKEASNNDEPCSSKEPQPELIAEQEAIKKHQERASRNHKISRMDTPTIPPVVSTQPTQKNKISIILKRVLFKLPCCGKPRADLPNSVGGI